MLKIDKMTPMEEYLALLGRRGEVYIDNDRLEAAFEEAGYVMVDYQALASLELRIESGGGYQTASADTIIDYLLRMGVDMDNRYGNRKVKGYSLDKSVVIPKLLRDNIAVNILEPYSMSRSYESYRNFLRGLVNNKVFHAHKLDGSTVLKYATHVSERANLRVYYTDIAVVNIPKVFSSIVTTPSDAHHIAWCDYPQADWRFAYNLFIKDETNEHIMRECSDAYEALARIVEGDKFNPDEFKRNRKEYKVNCLSVFYNSSNIDPIPKAMRDYFRSRKKYMDYIRDLETLYKFKMEIPCTTYFGFTQNLPTQYRCDTFVSKGLNTPIQSFTSHVVCETVVGIIKKFRELGYTEDDIDVYYVRHDEPVFIFQDTILEDAWVFKDCSEIHIDGFTPIQLDFHFGNYYQEEDEDLTRRIQGYMNKYPGQITTYETGEMLPYSPIPSVVSLYSQMFLARENEYIVVFYEYKTEQYYRVNVSSLDFSEVFLTAASRMALHMGSPVYMLVRGASLDIMTVLNDESEHPTLLKGINEYEQSLSLTLDTIDGAGCIEVS